MTGGFLRLKNQARQADTLAGRRRNVQSMLKNSINTAGRQPWRGIRVHFDLVKITVKRTRRNWTIRQQQNRPLAQDFCRWAYGNSRLPKRYFCERFRKMRRDFIFPASQVSIMGMGKHTAATILISNTNPRRPKKHHKMICQIGKWLDRLGYHYCVSIAELALDAYSQDVGLWMATTILPTWARLNRLWNFANGYMMSGGSFNGLDEYMFSGRVIWVETTRGKKGQRLPRRQFHTYYKPPGTWRLELRLFRSYLRDNSIRTIEELFRTTPNLVARNIRFRLLNKAKLRKEHPSSRNWQLTGKSISEQLRIIMERRRCKRSYAMRYFKPINDVALDLSPFSIPMTKSKPERQKTPLPARKRPRKRCSASPIMLPDNWTGG